jgi:hypothetical protein
MLDGDGYCSALSEIARWWRTQQRALGPITCPISKSASRTPPRAGLQALIGSVQGQSFIKQRIGHWKKELESSVESSKLDLKVQAKTAYSHGMLASYLEKCGEIAEALKHFGAAIAILETSNECAPGSTYSTLKFERERVRDQREVRIAQCTRMKELSRVHQPSNNNMCDAKSGGSTNSNAQKPKLVQVDRYTLGSLSYVEFMERYAMQGRPVIITGGAALALAASAESKQGAGADASPWKLTFKTAAALFKGWYHDACRFLK